MDRDPQPDRTEDLSEARLRGILDSAMDAIITIDERQSIVMFNAAAESMFGCTLGEALGKSIESFIPTRFRPAHAGHIRNFGNSGTHSRRMGSMRIITGLRANGEEFPIDASISQLSEHGHSFYTVILRDITQSVQAQEALRKSKEELREMASAASSVREHEKSRIARELHDEMGQSLTALKMDTTWLQENLDNPESDVKKKLASMETLLDGLVASTRRIARELRPLILDDLGLIPAAEWLLQSFTDRTGIACNLQVGDPEPDLQEPHATAVFRILQESLNNIAKHAKANKISVIVEQDEAGIRIEVRDNGVGFAPDTPRKLNSFGLLGVRERAYLLGGIADIVSAPNQGTCITVLLPAVPGVSQA